MPTRSEPIRGRLRAAVLGLLTLLTLLVTGAVAAPMASAGICQTCPEPPPPIENPTPQAPWVKYQLTIKKIVVHDINDDDKPFGHELSDEVYINVAGQRVWGTVSVDEFAATYTVNAPKNLAGPKWDSYLGTIEIWDDDDSSADDKLGELSVYGNGSTTEITGTYRFKKSASDYSMEIGLRRI